MSMGEINGELFPGAIDVLKGGEQDCATLWILTVASVFVLFFGGRIWGFMLTVTIYVL